MFRTTYDQATYGVTVPATALQPGDLLFFDDGTPLGNVAIYLGNGLTIQAPHTGTVVSISPVTPSSLELARPILI
jgi:peptidoglycan DL-endopeptidase CwlO